MAQLPLPPSINDVRGNALMALATRLQQLDLSPTLVYRIDSVPAAALPFLAWQFDVLSPLWQLIAPPGPGTGFDAITSIDLLTDIDTLSGGLEEDANDAQRQLLQIAVQLHRRRGTPWAIKTALQSLGWDDATLAEGQASWDGTQYPVSQGWAAFRVVLNLGESDEVTSGDVDDITAAANFFKPARALLDSVWFVTPATSDPAPLPRDILALGGIYEVQFDSVAAPIDAQLSISITPPALTDAFPPAAPLYNRVYRHSGVNYGADQPLVADAALVLNGAPVLQGG